MKIWKMPDRPKWQRCKVCDELTQGKWAHFNQGQWWLTCESCAEKSDNEFWGRIKTIEKGSE